MGNLVIAAVFVWIGLLLVNAVVGEVKGMRSMPLPPGREWCPRCDGHPRWTTEHSVENPNYRISGEGLRQYIGGPAYSKRTEYHRCEHCQGTGLKPPPRS